MLQSQVGQIVVLSQKGDSFLFYCFIYVSVSLISFNQVHVCVWGLLGDAAQRRACLQTPQLPGLPCRGGLHKGWSGGPLHLEQRPLCPLGTQHGQQKPHPCSLLPP